MRPMVAVVSRVLVLFSAVAAVMLAGASMCPAWEVVSLKAGEKVEGIVVRETDSELIINPYFSMLSQMTYGLRRIPKADIVKRETVERPFDSYAVKLAALDNGSADAQFELAEWCKTQKLSYEADRHLRAAIDCDPNHAKARAAIGEAEAVKYISQRNREKDIFRPLELKYVEATSQDARKGIYAELKKNQYAIPQCYLDRVARSAGLPKGLQKEVLLTYGSDKISGSYTLLVPAAYDSWTPHPIVLALHGGGANGKDYDHATGSGARDMDIYQADAEKRGWLVLCPNAARMPWAGPEDDALLEMCLREIELKYNVDLNRVYLIGHSMGGSGAWEYGAKWSGRFAAVSANSCRFAGEFAERSYRERIDKLLEAHTAVYHYHGADDTVCGVGGSRMAADMLRAGGADFTYTEIPNSGHDFPAYVVSDTFRFFDLKRLMVQRGKGKTAQFACSEGSRSSFLQEPSKDELSYLGPVGGPDAGKGTANEVKSLVDSLAKGGGGGEAAKARLIALKDKSCAKRLCGVLAQASMADARVFAADVLGEFGDKSAVQPLSKALGDRDSAVRGAAAEALGRLGDPAAVPALLGAVAFQFKEFGSKRVGEKEGYWDSDWQEHIESMARTAVALGKIGAKEKRAVSALVSSFVDGVLMLDVRVAHPEGTAFKDPKAVKDEFCVAVVDALGNLGQAAGAEPVRKLMSKYKESQKVQSAGEAALKKIESGSVK
jgi:predicted esterase